MNLFSVLNRLRLGRPTYTFKGPLAITIPMDGSDCTFYVQTNAVVTVMPPPRKRNKS